MARRVAPLISNFTAGELDPSIDSRVDISKYFNGARALENFIVQPQGSARKRPGSRFVARSAVDTTAWGSRLVPFEFNVEQAYIVEFTTGGDVYFYTQGGPLLSTFEVTGVAYSSPTVTVTVTGTATLNSLWQVGERVKLSGFSSVANEPMNYKTYTITAISTTTLEFEEAIAPDTGDAAIGSSLVFVSNQDVRYTISHPYTATDAIQEMQFAQSGDILYLAHRSVNPKRLSRVSAIAFTLTDHINVAPFGSAGNYPGCVELFQQRLWYASTLNNPQTVWASETGNFSTFTGGTGDTKTFSFTLPEANRIEWLRAHDEMLIGSAGGSFRVDGGDFGVTATTIAAKSQARYGSDPAQAIAIDNSVLFIQRGGKRVREMSYSFADNKYSGADLLKLALHITGGAFVSINKSLRHITYQFEPNQVVWGITRDRRLVGATFDKAENVLAWHQHPMRSVVGVTPRAEFVDSVAVIPVAGGEQVWIIATRYDNGTAYRSIEYLDDGFDYDNPEDAYFVDAGLTFDREFSNWSIAAFGPPARIAVGNALKEFHSDGSAPSFVQLKHSGIAELASGKIYQVDGAFLNWAGSDFIDIKELDASNVDVSSWTFGADDTVSGQLVPTSISGLDHIDGQTVSVLADGAVIEGLTVSAGAVSLPAQTYAGVIHAGIPHRARLKNMPLAIGQVPSIGKVKNWSQVEVLVRSTGTITIQGNDIPIREVSDPMDMGPDPFSGILQIEDESLADTLGHVEIISDKPVPCDILAITGQAMLSDN